MLYAQNKIFIYMSSGYFDLAKIYPLFDQCHIDVGELEAQFQTFAWHWIFVVDDGR